MKKTKTIALVIILTIFLLALYIPRSSASYTAPINPDIKLYSFLEVEKIWHYKEWQAFSEIVRRESEWNHLAQNKKSTAFGLGQFLNSTWATVGCEKTEDPYKQIDCAIKYIDKNYGSPSNALTFWNKHKWY